MSAAEKKLQPVPYCPNRARACGGAGWERVFPVVSTKLIEAMDATGYEATRRAVAGVATKARRRCIKNLEETNPRC